MADDFNEIDGVKKYSTKQVADLLNIDKSTLLRWIRQKKIKDVSHRDGRSWRVWLPEDVIRVKEYYDSIHNLSLNLSFEKKAGEEEVAPADVAVEAGADAAKPDEKAQPE